MDKIVTIPNVLSSYRLIAAPVIVALALTDMRTLFIVFLMISLVTDVLDGFIARTFAMKSRLGARLDSIADDLTYVAAFVGIFHFEYDNIGPHIFLIYLFIILLVATTAIPLLRFRRTPAFHLYLFRASGYAQALFVVLLFLWGFNIYVYYFAFSFGIVACIEVIAVALIVDAPITDARGLYWVLKGTQRGRAHG